VKRLSGKTAIVTGAAHRDALVARGIKVSDVFHYAGGPFNNTVENPRVGGRNPQGVDSLQTEPYDVLSRKLTPVTSVRVMGQIQSDVS